VNREEDLNEDDVEKLTSRDVVAIARGRREAALRFAGDPPRAAPAPVARNRAQNVDEDTAHINSLVDQLEDEASTRAARTSLLEYLRGGSERRVPLALEIILKRSWQAFAQLGVDVAVPDDPRSVDWWISELTELNKREPDLVHSWKITDAACSLVNDWAFPPTINLDKHDHTQDADWTTMIHKIRHIARLCGKPVRHGQTSILSSGIFGTLWQNMAAFLRDASWAHKQQAAHVLRLLAGEIQTLGIERPRPLNRIDFNAFFTIVEDARDEALEKQDADTASVLGVSDHNPRPRRLC
jgi:hypothetical protein